MKKFKFRLSNSPYQNIINAGRQIAHGFTLGIQKASIDETQRSFKPYKLPSVRWTNNQISILKYAFEDLKRWYD